MAEDRDLESLGLISDIMERYKAEMSEALRRQPSRLKLMEAHVLRIVLDRKVCTQLDVVRDTRRDKAQIAKLVTALTNRNLLSREVDPSDARRVRLSLTKEGRALASAIHTSRAAIARSMFEDLIAEDQEALIALLRRARGDETNANGDTQASGIE